MLEYHGSHLASLMDLLLHKSWPCLHTLKICHADLPSWHAVNAIPFIDWLDSFEA